MTPWAAMPEATSCPWLPPGLLAKSLTAKRTRLPLLSSPVSFSPLPVTPNPHHQSAAGTGVHAVGDQ
ncbi:MAG: hypothetical protein R2849_14170 [Thermomicrobiales bacterium]